MGNFDKTTPTGADSISSGDDNIREFKVAIEEALRGGTTEGDEAIFPGSAPTTAPVYRYRGLKGDTASIPTAGQYGMYFDTDKQAFYRDNGTSWDAIGYVIPEGTKEIFYQATAPVGYTRDTTAGLNDKFISVVTAGSPGTTGGVNAASTDLRHRHTITHTHNIAHTHELEHTHTTNLTFSVTPAVSGRPWANTTGNGVGWYTTTSNTYTSLQPNDATTDSQSTSTSGAASDGNSGYSFTSGAFAQVYCMIATKDAY